MIGGWLASLTFALGGFEHASRHDHQHKHKMDADTTKSLMPLVGGILTLTATISAIIHARLDKAKTAAQRQQVITKTLHFLAAGTCFLSFILEHLGLRSGALWMLALTLGLNVALFLRGPEPPSRFDIAFLIVFTCGVTLIIALGIVLSGLSGGTPK